MTESDLQLKLLSAAWNAPTEAHYLRSVPDEYFSQPGLIRIKHKILNDEPLLHREITLLKQAHPQGDTRTYAATLIDDGFVEHSRRFGEELTAQAHRKQSDELTRLLLNPPSKPALEAPLSVHERTDVELSTGVKFAYQYPEELSKIQYKLGRLYPGALHVVAADNGGGKSLYLEQMALGLANEAPGVCDFSVEMPFVHRLFRYIQHQSGASIGLDKYFEGELSKADIQELTKRLPKNLHIVNPVNINDVLSVAEQLYRSRGVTVFFLDFLQALQPLKGMSKFESISYNAEAIYHFTKRFPTVWFMASQYNREGKRNMRTDANGKSGRPSNSDLFGANEIETYAWSIAHILRPDETSTDRIMHITKNRFGVLGEVPMQFNNTLLTFKT